MMTDEEINEVARHVLANDTTRTGFLGSETMTGVDFEGAPVIRVTARYETMPIPARSLDGMHEIRTELLKRGEERIVFLTNVYEDELSSLEDDDS